MNISEIDDENFTVKRNETRKHNLVYKSINIETIKFDEIDNLIIDIIKMFKVLTIKQVHKIIIYKNVNCSFERIQSKILKLSNCKVLESETVYNSDR